MLDAAQIKPDWVTAYRRKADVSDAFSTESALIANPDHAYYSAGEGEAWAYFASDAPTEPFDPYASVGREFTMHLMGVKIINEDGEVRWMDRKEIEGNHLGWDAIHFLEDNEMEAA